MNATTRAVFVRPLHVVAVAALAVASSACDSCGKAEEKPADAPAGAAPANPRPEAQMPTPGTDADNKRVAALELQQRIDADLATFKHDSKGLDGTKTAEAWWIEGAPAKPKKLVVNDGAGAVTTMYFDDDGRLGYAKSADGLFIFHMEGLALWLDGEQRLKRGVKPPEASAKAQALKKEMAAALAAFKLR